MAPLFTGYTYPDGRVSPLLIEHYRQAALGGAALVTVASASVHPDGALSHLSLRVDRDSFVEGLTELASAIGGAGAVSVLQINHGGRLAKSRRCIAPSPIPLSDMASSGFYRSAMQQLSIEDQWTLLTDAIRQRSHVPREMTHEDIETVIDQYAQAAGRAQRAGFDMVEIHGASSYLPVQFLSERTNFRRDRYGGSLENRMRFALELIRAVKAHVGPNYPTGYRFLAEEWVPGGITIRETSLLARKLSQLGVAYLSVTAGVYESLSDSRREKQMRQPGYVVPLADEIRSSTGGVPVMVAGRITHPKQAEKILHQKKADLIGLGRPIFADPQWPEKASTGRAGQIHLCSGCDACFVRVVTDRPALCEKWDTEKRIRKKAMIKENMGSKRKILLAIDGSESAAMGALYASEILQGRQDVTITMLHVLMDENESAEREIRGAMDVARNMLVQAGIPEAGIYFQIQKKQTGIARDILREIREGGYGTVIIGRRGISRARQMLFGSTSNKIVHNASDCTVWVVD